MKYILYLIFVLFLSSCTSRPEVIDDFSDTTFHFINQDSSAVQFPDDFEGNYVVMGFIYTHCPDICTFITQNLIKTQELLNHPDDIQFVAMTFDPKRDTPKVLKAYGEAFNTGQNFNFLTGDTLQIEAFMDSARVRSQVSLRQVTDTGKEIYFMNHSDKIMVFDKKGRVIIEYGGSMKMVPSLLAEDLKNIR